MSLFLVEMRLDVSTPEKVAQITERVEQAIKAGGTPTARLVAGPWSSLENPTLFWVLENPDLSKSMPEIMELYGAGLISDQRIRPIMDWEGTKAAAAKAEELRKV
jgi:hypothetical protein